MQTTISKVIQNAYQDIKSSKVRCREERRERIQLMLHIQFLHLKLTDFGCAHFRIPRIIFVHREA